MRYNKYRVSSKEDRTVDGITFSSKGEMLRWLDLKLLQKAGKIQNLKRQQVFQLRLPDDTPIKVGKRIAIYKPDFTYLEQNEAGEWIPVIEDFKGVFTAESKLRIAVFEALYKINVRITGA